MSARLITTKGDVVLLELDNNEILTDEMLKDFVGGPISVVSMGDRDVMVVNEDAVSSMLPINHTAGRSFPNYNVRGDVVICYMGQLDPKWKKYFKNK